MSEPLDEVTREQLSAWLDGELDGPDRTDARRGVEALLASSAAARAEVEALRELRVQARDLARSIPGPQVWSGVRNGLRRSPAPRSILGTAWWIPVLAAGLFFFVGTWWGGRAGGTASPRGAAGLARWLLILHEPEGLLAEASQAEIDAVVAEYTRWAGKLARDGALTEAEKLVDGTGFLLRPGAEPEALGSAPARGASRIGGYFQIRAADEAGALALASDCPHLRYGGWIEMRPIHETGP